MTSWRPEFNPFSLYFITTSTLQHAKIFKNNATKQILIDHLDCFRRYKKVMLFSFVIMPNHLHLIIKITEDQTLGDFIRDYKSITGNRIKRYYLATKTSITSSHINVWEDDYNAKEIYSTLFCLQKVEYIHNNPCQDYWKLVEKPEDYPWSSARFYFTEKPCIIPIDDLRKYMA